MSTAGRNITLDGADEVDLLAELIRTSGKSGALVSESDLRRKLLKQSHVSLQDEGPRIRLALERALQQCNDLQELTDHTNERYYYSLETMTDAYALMLLQKAENPSRLIAQVIRESSASYPKPVPAGMFTRPPFELTEEQVVDCLKQMGADEKYCDIASTTTSASTLFLYSTLHLEPDHASMLAEWFDVGQFENP